MKEQRAARFHLAVNQLEMFQRFVDAVHVSAGLIAGLVVIYASHQMRAFDHLEAAILSSRAIDRYQTTRHVREKTVVRIPVTVVLVPFPRAADERLLQHHLVVLSLIHISEPTRLLSISYAVFCLKKKK